MDLLNLMEREHQRIHRELGRCIDGWQTFRPERREHGALASLRAYLVALERSVWATLVVMNIDRAEELVPSHGLMHERVAHAARLCDRGDGAALAALNEVRVDWACFGELQAALHGSLAGLLTSAEMQQVAGELRMELAGSTCSTPLPPSATQRAWRVVRQAVVAQPTRARMLPQLTEAIQVA